MPGRNDPCHCGSSKKYKSCCLDKDEKEKPQEVIPAAGLSAKQKRQLADLAIDDGKLVHGSPTEPIGNPSPSTSHDLAWEYEYVASKIGRYRRLTQSPRMLGPGKLVDRMVVIDERGVTHVYYFEMSLALNQQMAAVSNAVSPTAGRCRMMELKEPEWNGVCPHCAAKALVIGAMRTQGGTSEGTTWWECSKCDCAGTTPVHDERTADQAHPPGPGGA